MYSPKALAWREDVRKNMKDRIAYHWAKVSTSNFLNAKQK
jgi:hypothetical protein